MEEDFPRNIKKESGEIVIGQVIIVFTLIKKKVHSPSGCPWTVCFSGPTHPLSYPTGQ